MSRILLREDVKLAAPGESGVLLGDQVREAGLDPEAFHAVIPGDCGTAGKVNINGRIYKIEEAVPEHERLCKEAARTPNFGERDHPQSGPSWNVLTRFLGGKTQILEDGSARFRGSFGVINNSLGRDMVANWRAGVPIGVSLRAFGLLEEHVIDTDSPYARMNLESIGRTVNLVSEVEFRGYDWVRVASAGTYLPPPEIRESYQRLIEAAQADQEDSMSFKTWSEFEKANPDAAKTVKDQIVKSLEEAAAVKDAAATAEAQKLKDELREAKVANAGLAESVKELVDFKRETEKQLTAAKLKNDVTESLDKFIAGRRAGAVIKANVLEELAEGVIPDLAAALKRAEKYAKLADAGAAGLSGNAAGGNGKQAVTEGSDGGVGAVAGAAKGAVAKLTLLSAEA